MASNNATSGAGNPAVATDVESGNPGTTPTPPGNSLNTKKFGEPLFGPSIGSVSSGPSWTVSTDKKVFTDELTTETVTGWVEKSKEPSNPTTTLQALVNLKRPTLRLSPLQSTQEDSANATNPDQDLHLHGLEFTYDCDAPKCGVHVYVHLPKNHPDAPPTGHSSLAKLQVFEAIQDGGFGNKLTIEDGAVLELGRFESVNRVASAPPAEQIREKTPCEVPAPEATAPSEDERSATPSVPDPAANPNGGEAAANTNNPSRRRFSHFTFRRRHYNGSVSGPALAVVDAERNNSSGGQTNHPVTESKISVSSKNKDEDGVKVTIRLVALDEQGTELASPNEQVTYLHIVRFEAKPEVKDKDEKLKAEDTRPWVVHVVKREATIGPHTFHLHEIYGLTSSANTSPATAPIVSHTYPPDPSTIVTSEEEDSQSECLLCLSSPREVVLLPCRHLVACKECALNMVEYGAGGTISIAPEPTTTTEETAGGGTAEGTAGGGTEDNAPAPATATTTTPTTPTTNARRKRKAKGWFCPVCRRPYTSMLRLTTNAPPAPIMNEKSEGDASSDDEGETAEGTNSRPPSGGATLGFFTGDTLAGNAGFFRPRSGFLRTLSGLGRDRPADIENQNQNANQNQGQNQNQSTSASN